MWCGNYVSIKLFLKRKRNLLSFPSSLSSPRAPLWTWPWPARTTLGNVGAQTEGSWGPLGPCEGSTIPAPPHLQLWGRMRFVCWAFVLRVLYLSVAWPVFRPTHSPTHLRESDSEEHETEFFLPSFFYSFPLSSWLPLSSGPVMPSTPYSQCSGIILPLMYRTAERPISV